jgi:hypothetical protein
MPKKNRRAIPSTPKVKVGSTMNKPAEFNPDYSQVKRDLRRIGILAGSFVGILIVLAIFQDKLLALFQK